MAQKFYVVWQGRKPGIYRDWPSCKQQVDGFTGARYKSFKTQNEAEAAYAGAPLKPTKGKPKSGNGVKTYNATEVAAVKAEVKIFTDGGCDPNPGKAGSGIALYHDGVIRELHYGLYNPNGTNNTAELNALHQALLMAKPLLAQGQSVAIFCDSKYSIQCVTQWAIGWQKKGWKKSGGEIKNLALIQDCFALHQALKQHLQVLHVNGHVGIEGNELADRMSMLAINERQTQFVAYQQAIDIKALLAMRAG